MHHRGRLQRVPLTLATHVAVCQAPHLGIDHRHHLVERRAITVAEPGQQLLECLAHFLPLCQICAPRRVRISAARCIIPGAQINKSARTWKNSASFFACSLLMDRLPPKISETRPLDPMTGHKSDGFNARCSRSKAPMSPGVDFSRGGYAVAS